MYNFVESPTHVILNPQNTLFCNLFKFFDIYEIAPIVSGMITNLIP